MSDVNERQAHEECFDFFVVVVVVVVVVEVVVEGGGEGGKSRGAPIVPDWTNLLTGFGSCTVAGLHVLDCDGGG